MQCSDNGCHLDATDEGVFLELFVPIITSKFAVTECKKEIRPSGSTMKQKTCPAILLGLR